MPVPVGFVVKKGWKILCIYFFEMPIPLSLIVIVILFLYQNPLKGLVEKFSTPFTLLPTPPLLPYNAFDIPVEGFKTPSQSTDSIKITTEEEQLTSLYNHDPQGFIQNLTGFTVLSVEQHIDVTQVWIQSKQTQKIYSLSIHNRFNPPLVIQSLDGNDRLTEPLFRLSNPLGLFYPYHTSLTEMNLDERDQFLFNKQLTEKTTQKEKLIADEMKQSGIR